MEMIRVQNNNINIDEQGFICLTDMAKAGKPDSRPSDVIRGWLLTKQTIEYLTAWESLNNDYFKTVESHGFRNDPSTMNIDDWIGQTEARGIYSRKGKYGGTYAHKDIAYEFGAHISPMFKLYIIKEYQRLKEIENNLENLEWLVRRSECKDNYMIQTDAVKNYKIPFLHIAPESRSWAYAQEADAINIALWGFTASYWRKHNLTLAGQGKNIRDFAATNELRIVSILEGMNADMIMENKRYEERLAKLKAVVAKQLPILNSKNPMYSLKKATDNSFQPLYQEKGKPFGMFPQMPMAQYKAMIDKGEDRSAA